MPRYYEEKGFAVILVSRILNLLALAFTIAFSAFLLLSVKWGALHSECILRDTCDISEVSLYIPKLRINTPVLPGLMTAPATICALPQLLESSVSRCCRLCAGGVREASSKGWGHIMEHAPRHVSGNLCCLLALQPGPHDCGCQGSCCRQALHPAPAWPVPPPAQNCDVA